MQKKKIKSVKDFQAAFESIKHERRLPKKRMPTRFNAKKLKERHGVLWASIARQVEFDMLNQKQILNSKKNNWCKVGDIPLRYTNTVSENAAFTAIVEMIKRGLL